ncbi:Lachrymatory-factor synthase [Thalictrum thalictroides]|uniref:Lachrymatory-factor synthase n=1 Tax=Thalictrum thalictroides TaxID=46969 RepID=A0A7J6WZU1_THATH|nr:Lachrymatory-factor synthase [Thalictrum thalictroides]
MADQKQWEGTVSVKLTSSTADQIWPLYVDFCNLHKWLTIIDSCQHVEGSPDPAQPGCIRYVSGPGTQLPDGTEGPRIWANEKLLTIDHTERCLSYEITEGNMGFKNYVANIKVSPGDENGCVIEWSYVTDPIDGMASEQHLVSLLSSTLHTIAKRMEEAIHSS